MLAMPPVSSVSLRAAVEGQRAHVAAQRVVADATVEGVVALQAVECVVAVEAVEQVVGGRADEAVAASGAVACDTHVSPCGSLK